MPTLYDTDVYKNPLVIPNILYHHPTGPPVDESLAIGGDSIFSKLPWELCEMIVIFLPEFETCIPIIFRSLLERCILGFSVRFQRRKSFRVRNKRQTRCYRVTESLQLQGHGAFFGSTRTKKQAAIWISLKDMVAP